MLNLATRRCNTDKLRPVLNKRVNSIPSIRKHQYLLSSDICRENPPTSFYRVDIPIRPSCPQPTTASSTFILTLPILSPFLTPTNPTDLPHRQNNTRLSELSSKVSALRGVTVDIYDNARDQHVIDNSVRPSPSPSLLPPFRPPHLRTHFLPHSHQ